MTKPIVLIAEELSPATLSVLGDGFEIKHCNGADRAELMQAIADVDAILVRSATKIIEPPGTTPPPTIPSPIIPGVPAPVIIPGATKHPGIIPAVPVITTGIGIGTFTGN